VRFGASGEKKTEEREYEERTNGFRHIRIVAEWGADYFVMRASELM
jgi:hypothetical protein